MTYPGQWRNKPNNATVSDQQNIMTKRTQHEDFLCWIKWCGKHVLVIALGRMGLNHSNNFFFLNFIYLFYNISSLFANSHNTHQLRKNLHVQSSNAFLMCYPCQCRKRIFVRKYILPHSLCLNEDEKEMNIQNTSMKHKQNVIYWETWVLPTISYYYITISFYERQHIFWPAFKHSIINSCLRF